MGKATFIAILRGINVSGQKKILMTELKDLLATQGLDQVQTYIQSGNIVFRYRENMDNESLEQKIEKAIDVKFNFEVPVVVRRLEELKKIVADNPFLNEKNMDESKLHITFLAQIPDAAYIKDIQKISYSPDRFILGEKEIYLYCPVNYGNTKLSNTFFERKLKTNATTRNWKTVNKLIELGNMS